MIKIDHLGYSVEISNMRSYPRPVGGPRYVADVSIDGTYNVAISSLYKSIISDFEDTYDVKTKTISEQFKTIHMNKDIFQYFRDIKLDSLSL